MNTLKLTINPYKDINIVNINEKELSLYNEFNNYLKESIFVWADQFCDIIEREINDDYELLVVAEPFESLFLEDIAKNSQLCRGYSCCEYTFASSIDKRYTVLRSLVAKYNCAISEDSYKLKAFIDPSLSLKLENISSLIESSTRNEAFVIVTDDEKIVGNLEIANHPVIAVLVSDTNNISCFGNSKYLWKVTLERLDKVIKSIVDRFSKIPYIVDAAKKMNSQLLSDSDKQVLELSVSIEGLVKVDPINKLEVGNTHRLFIKTIPSNLPLPELKVISLNPDVVELDGFELRAVSVGNTRINVYKNDEIQPIANFCIEVFRDKSVKRIILDRSEPNMGIGRSQKIDIKYEPADAEDSDYIVWSVDRKDIATVDDKGVVTAKGAGRIRVSASTPKVTESVIIDVLPNISQMTVSATDVKLNKGDTMPISVLFSPAKCFDSSCNWETDNSSVAYVETYNDGSSAIISKEVGECTLTCTATEGGCNVSCYVKVVDPIEESKKRKKVVDIACIIAIPIIMAILFLILLFIIGSK